MPSATATALSVIGLRPLVKRAIGWKHYLRLRRYLSGAGNSQWGRIVMNAATEELVRGLPVVQLDVLEISGSKWRGFGFKAYMSVAYPEYDVTTGTLPGAFDLIIAEQVLEHVLRPYRALVNMAAMLKPGGYPLLTSPFLVRIHEQPNDCTRWSETGLKHLLADAGFPLEATRTGSWGNRECVVANLNRRHEWIVYKAWKHSLRNEAEFPIHVWALAQKPPS